MSYDENSVQDAAAYLDKWHTNKNWRSVINLAILDMGSTEDDILGQLFGSYHDGMDMLRNLSGDEEFAKVDDAFANYDSDWKKYLLNSSVDEWKGVEWTACGFTVTAVTDHVLTLKDQEYIVYQKDNSNIVFVKLRSNFEDEYKRKPVKKPYVHNQVYIGNSGRVLVYDASTYPRFFHMNPHPALGMTTCSSVSSAEDDYGPLIPLVHNSGESNQNVFFSIK